MELSEVTVFTDDVAATAGFYGELTGETPVVDGDGVAIFDLGGGELVVHESYEAGEGDLPAEDHVAFAVDSVEDAFATLADGGHTAVRAPADYEWGRSAYLRDPDGRLVELAERERKR